MRFVFFGTPRFAALILEELIKGGWEPAAVVTNPDKPIKRSKKLVSSPVKECFIKRSGSLIYQPEKIRDLNFVNTLIGIDADLFITAAYGKIFPESMLRIPKIGSINVHASLLPEYRGANPIRRAIMDGKESMGVTIMHMVKEMDAGDMLEKAVIKINSDWDYEVIERKLALLGAQALIKTLPLLKQGIAKRTAQNKKQVTFASKLEKKDCLICFDQSATQIQNQIRALSPSPGAFIEILFKGQTKRLKLFKVKVVDLKLQEKELLFQKGQLLIGCSLGSIDVLELQMEGKKRISVQEYLKASSSHEIKIL